MEKQNPPESHSEIPKDVKELLRWKSPSRPFKKRNSNFYVNVGLILIIIATIALFVQEFLLIAALLAFYFYLYVSGTVKPITLEHRVTNRGIDTANHTYSWDELEDFWFTTQYGEGILNVRTKVRFPGRLVMLVEDGNIASIKNTLVKYIPFLETVPTNQVDQLQDWFNAKLPDSMR